MDSNIFVYGIGVVMSLMVVSLAGMAWRKRQPAVMQVGMQIRADTSAQTHSAHPI